MIRTVHRELPARAGIDLSSPKGSSRLGHNWRGTLGPSPHGLRGPCPIPSCNQPLGTKGWSGGSLGGGEGKGAGVRTAAVRTGGQRGCHTRGPASFLRTTKQQCFPQPSPAQPHTTSWALLPTVSTPRQVSPCTQSPKQPPRPLSIFAPCPLPGSGCPSPSHLLLCSRSFLRTSPEPHEGELHPHCPASCSSLHFTPTWTGCLLPVFPGNAASMSIAVSAATRALDRYLPHKRGDGQSARGSTGRDGKVTSQGSPEEGERPGRGRPHSLCPQAHSLHHTPPATHTSVS